MFEVRYIKNGSHIHHIDVDPENLLSILKAHKDKEINILSIEDENHYSYNYESLISDLKL